VLVFAGLSNSWSRIEAFLDRLDALCRLCERCEAQAVLILDAMVHESLARAVIERRNLGLAIAIDRYVPREDYTPAGATRVAYGDLGWPSVFVIGGDGTIQHVQGAPDGLEETLRLRIARDPEPLPRHKE